MTILISYNWKLVAFFPKLFFNFYSGYFCSQSSSSSLFFPNTSFYELNILSVFISKTNKICKSILIWKLISTSKYNQKIQTQNIIHQGKILHSILNQSFLRGFLCVIHSIPSAHRLFYLQIRTLNTIRSARMQRFKLHQNDLSKFWWIISSIPSISRFSISRSRRQVLFVRQKC